jgi:hypothetical protein
MIARHIFKGLRKAWSIKGVEGFDFFNNLFLTVEAAIHGEIPAFGMTADIIMVKDMFEITGNRFVEIRNGAHLAGDMFFIKHHKPE